MSRVYEKLIFYRVVNIKNIRLILKERFVKKYTGEINVSRFENLET